MNIEEFNTDGIVLDNGAFLASFRLKIQLEDQSRVWHYYGTPVPGDLLLGVPTVQHDAISLQLSDFADSAYNQARQIAVDTLTITE